MKQILFAILLLSLAGNAYAYTFSAVCSTGQTLYYNITSDSTVSVTWEAPDYIGFGVYEYYMPGHKPSGIINIPSTVTYGDVNYTVTNIGVRAFYRCFGITSIVIPDNVTSIDSYAFYSCSGIDSLYLGSGLTTIGNNAFGY